METNRRHTSSLGHSSRRSIWKTEPSSPQERTTLGSQKEIAFTGPWWLQITLELAIPLEHTFPIRTSLSSEQVMIFWLSQVHLHWRIFNICPTERQKNNNQIISQIHPVPYQNNKYGLNFLLSNPKWQPSNHLPLNTTGHQNSWSQPTVHWRCALRV